MIGAQRLFSLVSHISHNGALYSTWWIAEIPGSFPWWIRNENIVSSVCVAVIFLVFVHSQWCNGLI